MTSSPRRPQILGHDELALVKPFSGMRLSFPPVVERAYCEHMVQHNRSAVVTHWFIGLCLYNSFFVNDYLIAPNDIVLYGIGRFGLVTPVCVLAMAVAWQFRRWYECAICVPPLIMSAVLAGLIMATEGEYRVNYMFGLILLLMCGSVISRPRFRFTFWTVIIQCILFALTLFGSDAVPAHSTLVSVLFCTSGAVVSLLTTFVLERGSRRAFLVEMRLNILNRELDASASTDPLTGLANRRGLTRATDQLWAGPNTTVSLILIDVDQFKLFNDNYGHRAGDQCLATLATQVVSVLRGDRDLAVRFGGEELLVLLPGLDLPAAQVVAERIRLAILAAQVSHPVLGPGAVVTASMGVATATTEECSLLDLTARADRALYAAKSAGRNRVWPPLVAAPDRAVTTS